MSTSPPGSPATGSADKGFFGHPRALAHIFGVEMWERFSFYGMQGILLIYLYYSATDGGLGMPEAVAAGIVGAYGGAVYLSTILGAWVADRLLGAERVLFFSAIVIVAGHIALALLPGFVGVGVGLVLVAIGGLVQYSFGRRALPDEARKVSNSLPRRGYPSSEVSRRQRLFSSSCSC